MLGVSMQTLGALAAGFQANGSTVALVERRLSEIAVAMDGRPHGQNEPLERPSTKRETKT